MRSTGPLRWLPFASAVSAHCSLDLLKNATAIYIGAQTDGSSSDMLALAAVNMTYIENDVETDIAAGVLSQAVATDSTRSVYDVMGCATFTEVIAASNPHPYVIGTRMVFTEQHRLQTMESVVTDQGDWAFNATGYRYWNSLESWDPIPADRRDSREVIQAAGDAYFDRFMDESVVVPFGTPCARLEGGVSTAPLNMTGDSCTAAGLPSTLVVTNRRYVVDEEMGVVDIFLGFPGLDRSQGDAPMPDSHMFRVENGKIRSIHTVSACVQAGCGMNGTGIPTRRGTKISRIRHSQRLF
ncbi:hypothetical protein F4780DRAFT_770798 [Xylariomycetidae sp. FL0641]|nr:hypothetical protein F4780DRAFT_770798 [Xylariomycetidae sp. FL0641]